MDTTHNAYMTLCLATNRTTESLLSAQCIDYLFTQVEKSVNLVVSILRP